MPLAAETVDLIWARMSVAYGHRFLSIFEGFSDEVVKADWAHQLGSLPEHRILWGLDHLPARVPDAPSFRQHCQLAPQPDAPLSLPHGPKAPAPRIARLFADHLHNAPKPEEPEKVLIARRYIAMWGGPEAKPTFTQREHLAHYRRVIERFENEQNFERSKAETQARVDALAEQEEHHAP